MKNILKQLCLWTLILTMVLSGPMSAFAEANQNQEVKVNHNDIAGDKAKFINERTPVQIARPEAGKTAEDLVKNPAQPAIYTLRTDYQVQRGDKYVVDYQPYIASVGEAASDEEKAKVNQTVKMPDLAGYEKPDDDYKITYDKVKKAADGKGQTGNDTNGLRYQANEDFRYKAKANEITIKHVFQDLQDFSKYTNPDGTVGEEGQLITTQNGNTGSTMEVSPLGQNHPNRRGFVPEAPYITMQVPENAENFILEYRYNRAHYDVNFDTKGGTPLPNRTLYYEQIIPTIDDKSIPTKVGSDFLGWKPSITLETTGGKTYPENQIIKDGTGKPIFNLAADLKMPASKITFTAVWKDKEKADYAIQFWAEKSDHADDASIMDKYEYMGTRVYKDKDTGTRPNLDAEPVTGLKFPDLNQARLNKIWANARFNRDHDLYLNKFFVYNKDLTDEQNKDPDNARVVKSVSSTGKTVYNIYYDRQVYDLYFTKSNAQPKKNTIYPEIWKYDEKEGEAVMAGGPGKPYHYKARFNEMMYKWPNDAKQTKGFTPGYQSFGWGPNYTIANWPLHLDTPPYRLNADEFLDMANYTSWGGYTKHIDKGDNTTIDLDPLDFRTLSFGIKQDHPSIPHHMDFWMDGFKDGETIIRYDLVRTKADTAGLDYGHRYPIVTGFTPRDYDPTNPQSAWPVIREGSEENGRVTAEDFDDLNDEREDITPNTCGNYYNNNGIKLPIGQLDFIPVFYSDADPWGDVKEGGQSFKENGYLQFHYKRNKYPLRFNYDPSIIRDDSYFNSKNQLDTFYEFPLKVLSPDLVDSKLAREDREYFKDDPKNFLDNPENLQKLGLTDLVFTDKDGKLKVKRPDDLSDQMVFKGWALDPAGTKLIWENPKETMPTHPVNLYAKWGEPDYHWKVTFDPDGGSLKNIKEEKLTTERKKIQEGDIGQEETKTYPVKEKGDGNKQVFTVIQRQKLVEPNFKPEKKGYDFMGWEVIRYKKDAKTGDYTDEIDNSYRETYKVPELYSFGNDVVSPIYLKAIWVPNQRVDVKVEHYFLDKDYKLDEKISPNPDSDTLENKRAGYLVATTGERQDDKFLLAPHSELEEKLTGDLKTKYEEYNKRVGLNNSFFQTFRVEPEKILNTETNQMEENPKAKNNVFKFFYRPFRQREYNVNYIDVQFKGKETEKGAAIIDQEIVKNGNRHYDARNYRQIPGWALVGDPQQQLFFDVDEETNEFLGINKTGKKEITFYYKDVRVIEVPGDKEPPKGYVRVTFKADKGGSFGKDAEDKDIKELHYDVIKGLKSDFLPVPKLLAEGETVDANKHYITPETGKKFIKWDKDPLLNDNTIINENHTFTAYFEWSGLTASGLVRTESFKDPNNTWTNDFAPTIDQLKKQLVWREKDQVKDLPKGTEIKLFDENDNELTTDDQVYALVNEKKAADKDEVVRTVNIKAKVTFKDGKEPQELDIPITVYKNVYEALNKEGDKPLFLKEAEGKEAKDGGLKDVTGDYVMVTIKASKDFNAKDDKIYYVNKNAWVTIPEVKTDGSSTFVNWTADKDAQNEGQAENGIFDFGKRHKFTEDTVISPSDAKDVVEQKQGEDKPKVPDNYVKVIIKTTDNATDATKFEKTFWVNPTKEVPIDVTNPTGKTVAADPAKVGAVGYTMNFSKWETEDKAKTWTDKIVGQFENETTIVAKYSVKPEVLKPQIPTSDTVHTPQGKTPTVDELKAKITPPEGKTIKEVKIVAEPDVKNPGKSVAKVIVEYTDGSSVGTNEKPLEIPVEVHKPIVKADPLGNKPKEAMENYVKVIFKAGTSGTVSGDLIYYVSPEVEVDMTDSANAVTKTPSIGYTANGGTWSPEIKAEKITEEKTYEFNFVKSKDIVEKTDDPNQVIPKGYVKVIFRAAANGKLEGGVKEKIYYVNPKAGIKLVELADGQTAGEKELAVPKTIADKNFSLKEWIEPIDKDNPITGNREHVAHFAIGQVTLTYDANGAEGEVPAAVEVGHGTSVRLARPEGLSKDNATFAGWKIGETTYQAGEEVTLNENTTATAQWKANSHTVTFNTMGGGYIPRQTVEHGKTIGEVTPPTKDGFTFTGWTTSDGKTFDPEKDPVNGDITLVAKYVPDVIPQDGPTEPETVPKNFVEVKFVPTDKATDETKAEKIYWVNPKKEVTIQVTNPVGKQYFTFTGWKIGDTSYNPKDKKQFKEKTTVTANYEEAANIISYNPDEPITKPKGYVRVTFKAEKGLELTEQKAYYVKANAGITLANVALKKPGYEAQTGYKFDNWDKEDSFTITEDITVTAKATKLGTVIPEKDANGKTNDKPTGYKEVTFVIKTGDETKGSIEGVAKFYVNPTEYVTITPPTPKANMGFAFAAWDKDATIPTVYAEDTTITGSFNGLKDVIPQGKTDGTDKPAGYFTVTFVKGENGTLSGNTVYYVKSNTNVTVPAPTVTPASGYKHKGWDKALTQTFTGDTTITALYEKQKPVDPIPTPQPDPIPQPYPTPQPYPVPYPVPGETKTVYKDRTVLRREVRYMQGFEGKFRPDDGLTRAEAAQILANALKEDGYPFDLRYKLPYKDTTKEMWYNDAVRITTQADVFIGYDDGEFKPQRKITRAEWIATLRRFQYVDKVGGNSLHMRKNHWAIPEVEAAYRSGWLSIYTEKKAPFNYDEPISRKEVAAVSNRAFRRVRDMDYIRRNDKFMTNYTDINRDMWAYDDILCASNTFLHQRQGAYIAYKRGDKAYTIDVKDAIIEQDLFQRIPRHR